ncbi:GGDEF domain-containing protein [Phaeovibrio sulfidiphilus]|uniref:GGDEF domain-containing protein n=1 Tax=Phaeovibrio sulfidiphilus TaxID=1220600 RepID=A0A8J7CVN6_9PROT|nr:GGDEF domain-containing protein [Phaeovibrio sulfidiphilus]MBE1236511.1 GGDEF domain-containing protein [Phaeovibrio sulfidiphilus]
MSENKNRDENSAATPAELQRENRYLRKCLEHSAARLLIADTRAIAIRQELEQKRRGFALMAELAVALGHDADYQGVFNSTARRINAALNMQRTAVLIPAGGSAFKPIVLQGYSQEEQDKIGRRLIKVGPDLLDPRNPMLITGDDPKELHAAFRSSLALPYLIAAPVLLHSNIVALVVTGRMTEQRPFLPQLGWTDVETVQTVASYLAAILAGYRLRQAEDLANVDPLTQLPNLRGTTERMSQILDYARNENLYAATLFVDLDSFKVVNDTHGHAVGDMVLRVVAERLTHAVREFDLVGRIGGDEFIVVLSHISRPDDAATAARKIITSLSQPIEINGALCQVGASVGIAIFPEHGTDESVLIHVADEAMYEVKRTGKNNFAYARRSVAL